MPLLHYHAGRDPIAQDLDIVAADLERWFTHWRQALSRGYAKLKAV
jgi:hypothetical protein